MPWIIPDHQLDPQQKEFIDRLYYNRDSIWIKGFPGSGKSVLLAYTLKSVRNRNPQASVVIVVFTRALVQMFKEAFGEMAINGKPVEVKTFYEFMKSPAHYDYVLCDEVQDLVPSVLRAMRKRAIHVVVAGDENQSIYASDPMYHEETVKPSQIQSLLDANAFELGIIHRLSSSIIEIVQRFMPDMNIFSAKRDQTKTSTQVRLCEGKGMSEEVRYVMREAGKATRIGETAVVLLPTDKAILRFVNAALESEGIDAWEEQLNQYDRTDFVKMNSYLTSVGMNLKYVGKGVGSFSSVDKKIIIMTYHSSKGLDFENVFIPFVNSRLYIVPDQERSKTLFMVAMTRSRKNLYLTYSGYKHDYLHHFSSQCSRININDALASTSTSNSRNNGNVWGI